jgi:3-phenylpropionate/trans-cinnamate dioxygenase ferredoxin component
MEYIKVAQTTDLSPGDKKKVSYQGNEILLTNIQNAYYAIDNTCPHMGGSLYDGDLQGSHIVCPKHGSIFDVKTGQAVQAGKLLFIKVKVHDVRSYPIKIEGTDVLLGVE